MSELNIDINIEISLNILVQTACAYMEAFEFPTDSIVLDCEMIKKYKAFKKIVVFYLDSKQEVIGYASLNFDWDNYKVNLNNDDPNVLLERKQIVAMTPKQFCRIL